MQVGNLVRITDVGPEDTRGIGTILKLDTYNSERISKFQLLTPFSERIVEVLWSDTHIGWVLCNRLEVLNEVR